MMSECHLIELDRVDSTSRYLKEWLQNHVVDSIVIVNAKTQTHGYGQPGRRWQSDGNALTFSMALPVPKDFNSTFSLALACRLHQVLHQLTGEKLFLKWPNDLYTARGKVSGFLVEQIRVKRERTQAFLVIGIGINRSKNDQSAPVDKHGYLPMFNEIELFNALNQCFLNLYKAPVCSSSVFLDWQSYWKKFDYFSLEESVCIGTVSLNEVTGQERLKDAKTVTYRGVLETGEVSLEQDEQIMIYSSGQFSIRKVLCYPLNP